MLGVGGLSYILGNSCRRISAKGWGDSLGRGDSLCSRLDGRYEMGTMGELIDAAWATLLQASRCDHSLTTCITSTGMRRYCVGV